MDPFVIVVVGIFVVAIGSMIFGLYAQHRRRQAMQAFAAQHGWQWIRQDNSYAVRWNGAPFGSGQSRRARNVLVGRHRDRDVVVFDYLYTVRSGSGKSRRTTTYTFTVWVMTLPGSVPELSVGPEGVFGGRVAKLFGFGDLEVENEEFNRTFRVETDDQRFGSAVIHPRLMDLLLQTGPWSWHFEGSVMISYESDFQPVAELLPRFDLMAAVADTVPSFVWKDWSSRP